MAKELEIKITTKYDQAEKGFNRVTGSVQKYRNELLKASAEGKVTDETINNYVNALNKQLAVEDQTKKGMAALTAQAKLLNREMTEMGIAFGESDKGGLFKNMKTALDEVNAEMAKTPSLAKKASGEMDDFGNKSGNAALKLLSVAKNILKFQLLMGPITAAVRGFKNTLSDSVKVAAEAEQRYNKLATVFDGLSTSAKNAATAIAYELGVATSTSASALSTVGDLLQAQGMGTANSLLKSSEWVKQFQDIIAFKDINMSLEEFAQNFMSGAAGNLRNFRTFGSIVKESAVNARLAAEGLDKLTGSQLELAKMTTRATMALEQQKNAMGATQREWDTTLSVSRRLSEAWKEYKENLGDTINSVLTPLKSSFAALFDQINKAKRAQKEFNAGNRNIKVYDIYNNGEDSASFQDALSATYNKYGVHAGEGLDDGRSMVDVVNEIIIKFGATVATVQSVMGNKLTPEMYKELRALEKIRIAENKRLEAIETRRGNIGASTDTYESFTEALKAITGVNIGTPDWASVSGQFAGVEGGDRVYAGNVAASMMKAVSDALESINNADLAEAFGDVISGALDELDEKGLREAQVESLRKLFEASWNQFAEGGFTNDEKAKLEDIKKSYKQASDALDAYNKKIQIQAALLSASGSTASVLSNTARMKYENGLTGPQSSKDLNMALNWDIPLLVQDFAKSLRDAGVDLKTVMERSEGYRKALVAEANLKYALSLAAEDAAAREGLRSAVPTTSRTALANLGMSERDLERNQLVAKRDELTSKHNALWIEYQKEIDALDELTKLEAQKALLDKVNPFSGLQSAWQMGEAAGVGGITGILADILANTEAFSELAGIVSDTLVPIFNAILKPLMPALKAMTSLFDALPWDVFFEVFKIVAEAIVIISTVVKVISAVIKNIFTAVHNILQRILHPFTGGDQRPYENIEKILQDADENLEKIKNSSFEIERNTGEDANVAALRELWHAGIIDNQGVYEGAKVLQKDLAFESLDGYAANVTYNITNNITVNANDEEGMNKFKRTMEENGIPLGYTFRVNGYSY